MPELPLTIREAEGAVPPEQSGDVDIVVPRHLMDACLETLATVPRAAQVVSQLIPATLHLPMEDALARESLAYSALQSGMEYRTWLTARSPRREVPTNGNPQIRVIESDDKVEVMLDREDRANAINRVMRHELVEVFDALAHTTARITVTGIGAHFCSGGDLAEFGSVDDPMETHRIRMACGLPRALARVRNRVTAYVHGGVIGAGTELAAFAHRVIAQSDARFRLPEVSMGLLPGCGGTVSVPRRIGPNRALVLILAKATLTAQEAVAWGLVDEVLS